MSEYLNDSERIDALEERVDALELTETMDGLGAGGFVVEKMTEPMTPEELDRIKTRHHTMDHWRQYAQEDMARLLAEVERLRDRVEELERWGKRKRKFPSPVMNVPESYNNDPVEEEAE